jgi:murein DD-endopeptidase MepM/ murein hydrolase activator NlpD
MKKYFDFMVIPHGREPAINFRLSKRLILAIIGLVGVWIVALLVLTIFYGRLLQKAMTAELYARENEKLRDYNSRVVAIEKSFKKNLELVAKIAAMAGIEIEDLNPSLTDIKDSAQVDSTSRVVLAGLAGDIVPLSTEELEQMRVPQGRPLYGWITRGFSNGGGKDLHNGVDIAVKEGTPVVATATGKVKFAGWDAAFGNLIIIDHGNGYQTVYGHNQKMMVTQEENVYKGDVIALSGNTGRSSAPHLHYEVIKNNVPIDPSPYLD